MSVSASETEKAKSRTKPGTPRHYTEGYRLEAAGHCRKAREADPKKGIRKRAAGPGTSDKALNDRTLKHSKTGRVAQARTDEQKELDAAGGVPIVLSSRSR